MLEASDDDDDDDDEGEGADPTLAPFDESDALGRSS